jgi:hypothetical protein
MDEDCWCTFFQQDFAIVCTSRTSMDTLREVFGDGMFSSGL